MEELFKGRHFDQEIVILCVRWYLSYKLSVQRSVADRPWHQKLVPLDKLVKMEMDSAS